MVINCQERGMNCTVERDQRIFYLGKPVCSNCFKSLNYKSKRTSDPYGRYNRCKCGRKKVKLSISCKYCYGNFKGAKRVR